jgi:arylsulfatase A-like enzyme
MADDQGWGDVGYAGHPAIKTPNLDTMATAGIRFDRFYAAAPVCSPTRGSVMTGRHPNRYGCFSWGYPLRPQENTLAAALRTAGYRTGHFGKWHLGSVQKTSPVNPGASGFDEWLSAPNFFDNDPILSREGVAVPFKGESSIVTADAAIDFIRKHAKDPQPFFAVVWFGSPHSPHQAAAADRGLYPNEPPKLQNYYGEISGIDHAMGKLRRELRSLGIQEDTIVWYCSDNGGVAGVSSTGGRGSKGQIYEGGLRVPAILEWPARITKPFRTDVPASTCDIFPTLLEVAGVRPDPKRVLDGMSLIPVMDRKTDARPKPIGFWSYPAKGNRTASAAIMAALLEAQKNGDEIGDRAGLCLDAGKIAQQYPAGKFAGHAAWLDWPWKLHRIEGKDGAVKIELYDLAADPGEKSDDTTAQPQRAQSMRADLEKWLASVAASLNGGDYR